MGKFLKRLAWRWKNLTVRELFNSYFPVDIHLPDIRLDKYDALVRDRIQPDPNASDELPFVFIKPGGMPLEGRIKDFIASKGMRIAEERGIDNYVALAVSIYKFQPRKGSEIPQNYIWAALEDMKMPHRTKCFILDKGSVDLAGLREFKKELRHFLGPIKFYRIHYHGAADTAFASYVHVPERQDIAREYSVLRKFLEAQDAKH